MRILNSKIFGKVLHFRNKNFLIWNNYYNKKNETNFKTKYKFILE